MPESESNPTAGCLASARLARGCRKNAFKCQSQQRAALAPSHAVDLPPMNASSTLVFRVGEVIEASGVARAQAVHRGVIRIFSNGPFRCARGSYSTHFRLRSPIRCSWCNIAATAWCELLRAADCRELEPRIGDGVELVVVAEYPYLRRKILPDSNIKEASKQQKSPR